MIKNKTPSEIKLEEENKKLEKALIMALEAIGNAMINLGSQVEDTESQKMDTIILLYNEICKIEEVMK